MNQKHDFNQLRRILSRLDKIEEDLSDKVLSEQDLSILATKKSLKLLNDLKLI